MVILGDSKPSHIITTHTGDQQPDPRPSMSASGASRDGQEAALNAPPAYLLADPETAPLIPRAKTPRHRPLHRLLAALLVAVAILGLLHFFTRSMYNEPPVDIDAPPAALLPPQEGRPGRRASWSSPVKVSHPGHDSSGWVDALPWYSSVSNFTLPYSAATEVLFLHVHNTRFDNQVHIITDPSLAGTNLVKVGVEVVFHYPSVRDALWVGELTKGDSRAKGVGIFAWDEHAHLDRGESWTIDLYVHLRLPPKDSKSVTSQGALKLPDLEVEAHTASLQWHADRDDPSLVPQRVVMVSESGSIKYHYIEANESINISTASGSIHGVGSGTEASAKTVAIKSQSGSSQGVYKVLERLDLLSESGSIHAEVTLPGKKTPSAGYAESSLDIEDHLLLREGYEQSQPRVTAHAKSGSIHLTYLSQHPSVELHSDTASFSGSTQVKHADHYQGRFLLATTSGSAHYSVDPRKTIHVELDQGGPVGRRVEGTVSITGEDQWSTKGTSSVKAASGSVRVAL